ncbi:MAG: methyltransferase domain-containing protein [Candidatus Omnitrophica bacterium]|nr:methyltransferase domain-containing protein [Candidatus Omnitrophota bacterium]
MNKYDDVILNVAELLERQDQQVSRFEPAARSGDALGAWGTFTIRTYVFFIRMFCRLGIYRRLLYANMIVSWFDEFRHYWVNELNNRPIQLHDFYYLFGIYRSKFQDVCVPDTATNEQHLIAWQDPRNIYLLFSQQYKLALDPMGVRRFIKYIPQGGKVCEFGSGFAPIASGLSKFYRHFNVQITCVDIPTILLHFIRWKFKEKRFVRVVKVEPNNDAPLDEQYDTLFCTTVFEHLPRPLNAVKHLHAHIKTGGYFIFDYIKSEGEGLDTDGGLRDRIQVLRFIKDNFKIVEGEIFLDGKDVKTVVCRKT